RRYGPDPPPCCGARWRIRSSRSSTGLCERRVLVRQGGPKRKVSPAIVVRLSLLYRLGHPTPFFNQLATWRSGDAADCKSAYPGSIPGVASNTRRRPRPVHALQSSLGFVIGAPADETAVFPGSSAVEHSTVNRMVAGSIPAQGANLTAWL